jgi:hypothetical protein
VDDLAISGNPFSLLIASNLIFAASSLSLNRSAMAVMFIFVCCDIEEITAVPLPPHPMIPILIAEFALLPNAILGLTIVRVERAAVLLMNFLRSRCVIMLS